MAQVEYMYVVQESYFNLADSFGRRSGATNTFDTKEYRVIARYITTQAKDIPDRTGACIYFLSPRSLAGFVLAELVPF